MLIAGRPFTIDKYFYPEVRRRYAALLQSTAFDLIVCDFIFPAPLIDWKTPPPKILFTHNVEAQVWARHYKIASNPVVKMACWLEFRALQRAERHYVQLADYVLAVSENDRASFAQYADPRRISVIPTGVDTEYFQPEVPSGPSLEQPDTMAFTGGMDWMPNEDGVAYFVEKILPLIRRQIPEAAFWAVGRRPPRRIQALASDSVVVTGTVEDIRPYLAKAALCVVPLRSGSGTRIKIFEAMAMGKAVVSTSMGAEGLPVQHGKNIILADDPADFARQVVDLLRDPPRRQRLARGGGLFRWNHAGRPLNMRAIVKSTFYACQRQAARLRLRWGSLDPHSRTRFAIFSLHTIAGAASDMAISEASLRAQPTRLLEAGYRYLDLPEALRSLAGAPTRCPDRPSA
jgi:polysaccharide biosynthesis protein PslH